MLNIPELVIFDLDGTLIDYQHEFLFQEALRVLPQLGYPNITRTDLEDWFCSNNFFGYVPLAEQRSFEALFWEKLDKTKEPMPCELTGVRDVLEYLNDRNILCAIATARACTPEELSLELHATGFMKFISMVATKSCDDRHWSEKAPQIQTICDTLGVHPLNAWMVGDNPCDVISARNAGLGAALAVKSGKIYQDILEQTKPDAILENVGNLKALLNDDSRDIALSS